MIKRKVLNCAVKTIWYNQIKKGTKRNEYREMSDYWIGKLFSKEDVEKAKKTNPNTSALKKFAMQYAGTSKLRWTPYTHICFHNAGQSLEFTITKITIANGMFVISFK